MDFVRHGFSDVSAEEIGETLRQNSNIFTLFPSAAFIVPPQQDGAPVPNIEDLQITGQHELKTPMDTFSGVADNWILDNFRGEWAIHHEFNPKRAQHDVTLFLQHEEYRGEEWLYLPELSAFVNTDHLSQLSSVHDCNHEYGIAGVFACVGKIHIVRLITDEFGETRAVTYRGSLINNKVVLKRSDYSFLLRAESDSFSWHTKDGQVRQLTLKNLPIVGRHMEQQSPMDSYVIGLEAGLERLFGHTKRLWDETFTDRAKRELRFFMKHPQFKENEWIYFPDYSAFVTLSDAKETEGEDPCNARGIWTRITCDVIPVDVVRVVTDREYVPEWGGDEDMFMRTVTSYGIVNGKQFSLTPDGMRGVRQKNVINTLKSTLKRASFSLPGQAATGGNGKEGAGSPSGQAVKRTSSLWWKP